MGCLRASVPRYVAFFTAHLRNKECIAKNPADVTLVEARLLCDGASAGRSHSRSAFPFSNSNKPGGMQAQPEIIDFEVVGRMDFPSGESDQASKTTVPSVRLTQGNTYPEVFCSSV